MGLLLLPILPFFLPHPKQALPKDDLHYKDHVFQRLKLASHQTEKSAFFSDLELAAEIEKASDHLLLIKEQIIACNDRLADLTEREQRLEETRVVLVELEKLPSRIPPPLPIDISQTIVEMTAETSVASAQRMTLVSEMFQYW